MIKYNGNEAWFSVLWHCWLGVRKSTRSVKISDEVLVWLSVWSMCRLFAYGPVGASVVPQPPHILPHSNPDWFLPFWHRLTQVVLEKRPLNVRSSSNNISSRLSSSSRGCNEMWFCALLGLQIRGKGNVSFQNYIKHNLSFGWQTLRKRGWSIRVSQQYRSSDCQNGGI